MVHGTSNLENDLRSIRRLSTTNQNPENRRKALSFNEPDGATVNGGSDISPHDAASAYIKYLLPLRNPPLNMQISHPSVTGTGNGLDWLRAFNKSCHELRPTGTEADDEDDINRAAGCPTDFLSVHHYGDLPALASWIGTLNGFYNADPSLEPDLPMYITEFALVQTSANAAESMLNRTMPYLDNLNYIAGYAWFGLFRTTEPNNWTGPGNALIDSSGGLSPLGSEYLGGSARGFSPGARGSVNMFKSNWDWGDGTSNADGGFANPSGGGGGGGRGRGGSTGSEGNNGAGRLTNLLYGLAGDENNQRSWGLVAVFVSLWALFWLVL